MHTPLERGYAIHFSPRNSDQSQFNLRSGYSRTHKIHCSHLARSEKVSTSRIGIWGLRNDLFPIAHGQKRDLVEVAFGKLRESVHAAEPTDSAATRQRASMSNLT